MRLFLLFLGWGALWGCKCWRGGHIVGFSFNSCVFWKCLLPASGCCCGWLGVWWVVCELYSGCEHLYCVFCVLLFLHVFMFVLCLVFVGIRWMPWYQELMKDVAACDNPWGVGERALI